MVVAKNSSKHCVGDAFYHCQKIALVRRADETHCALFVHMQIANMVDEYSSKPQYKMRSASISAPSSSSLEAIINAAEIEVPEIGTPNRRRRPATRSQSARITGAKSVSLMKF